MKYPTGNGPGDAALFYLFLLAIVLAMACIAAHR